MRFRVIRPYRGEDGSVRTAGSVVELGAAEAARLRARGMIGGPERVPAAPPLPPEAPPPETATKAPGERRRKGK